MIRWKVLTWMTVLCVTYFTSLLGFAQEQLQSEISNPGIKTDSVKARELGEVIVEGRSERLGAQVSTYIPTGKQKNASKTAAKLLDRMAIPQLRVTPKNEILTPGGKGVDIYIDFLPASEQDLSGMRMQDVKKVEYYDYPADPRFQGKPHVVNFVMQKYEYGGYLKLYGWETTFNTGQISLFGKLQYKRMTFDIAGGFFYLNDKHCGSDTYEIFRLPQPDGSLNAFERNSIQEKAKKYDATAWPTFKALYSSDKITILNVLGADFNKTPVDERSGYIDYSPQIADRTDYSSKSSSRINSVSYEGYWNFILNDNNSITFTPIYAYTHTNSHSYYTERKSEEYANGATDDSHEFKATLTYGHSFGKWGQLNAMFQTIITSNNTTYTGTANMKDYAHVYRFGPGVQYSIGNDKIYGLAGFGYHLDRQEYVDVKENSAAPWVDLSLQYSPTEKHSVSGDFHHMKSIPSSSYRSSAIIQSNPLMSYTGNPYLTPYSSYDAGVNYSFIPNGNFSMSVFGSTWIVRNRYVYDYQPWENGILRTIRQPGGGYSQWNYGIYAALRLFKRKLQLTAQVNGTSVHNGMPYYLNKTKILCALQATYYINNWYVSGLYCSPQGYPDGCMVGTWMETKSFYKLQAGWSNSAWNIQLQFTNFGRWHWRGDKGVMYSPYYDKTEQSFSVNDHAFARLAITYTVGFGKKIERGDEASQQSGTNSGILK